MRSIKTSSLVRRAVAASLGLAFSATAAQAGSISDTFATGTTLTATHMNNIKSAVNDNDTRITTLDSTVADHTTSITTLNTTVAGHTTSITTLNTDVSNLKKNIASGDCGTGMTRVGPTCVDNTRKGPNVAWSAAVVDCRALGKRLLTPGEWVAAKLQGALTDTNNEELEWVDAANQNNTDGEAYKMYVGYIGTTDALSGEIAFFNNVPYTQPYNTIYYRCAR